MRYSILDRRGGVDFGGHIGTPRVEAIADIVTEKTVHTFIWRGAPEAAENVETRIQERAALILRHDAVIDGYTALVGHKGKIGNRVTYTVTDCKIQILGPVNWRLALGWDEIHPGYEPVHKLEFFTSDQPDSGHPSPEQCLAFIEAQAGKRAASVRTGTRALTAHLGRPLRGGKRK